MSLDQRLKGRRVPRSSRLALRWFHATARERGAAAVLLALVLVGFVAIGALLVDAADTETEVRANTTRSDFAALAAGARLASDPVAACALAWHYIQANTPNLPAGAQSPCTTGVPTAFDPVCDASTAAVDYEAIGEEPYQITFTYPVTDSHPAMDGRTGVLDGNACERFGVTVMTQRPSIFGAVVGSSGLQARGSAVVRAFEGSTVEVPLALVRFDPVGCEALRAQGEGGVKVFPTDNVPGYMAIDSDGMDVSCDLNETWTIDAEGEAARAWSCGVGSTLPPMESCLPGGVISLHAMDPNQTSCSSGDLDACDPQDVIAGRVKPQPEPMALRLTRRPIDWRYNCKSSYPVYLGIVPIPGCPTATPSSDFIDELRSAIGDGGSGIPAGFTEVTTATVPGWVGCDTQAAGGTITIGPGNWWVNCPSGLIIKRPVIFQAGNVVLEGGVHVTSLGSLSVNEANAGPLPAGCRTTLCPLTSSESHAYVYVRQGGFRRDAEAQLTLHNVAMYIDHEGNGSFVFRLDGGSTAAPLVWTSPTEGPFEDLVLWSENAPVHFLAGQANQVIEGTLFTPFANPFDYSGTSVQNQTKAQFLSYRLVARGQGKLIMQVDPDRATSFPIAGFMLIR